MYIHLIIKRRIFSPTIPVEEGERHTNKCERVEEKITHKILVNASAQKIFIISHRVFKNKKNNNQKYMYLVYKAIRMGMDVIYIIFNSSFTNKIPTYVVDGQ